MSIWILAYFALGAAFGLATYSRRHLFSEGPSRGTDPGERNALDGLLAWTLVCSGLWPLMALTGLVSLWKLSRARTRTPDDRRR